MFGPDPPPASASEAGAGEREHPLDRYDFDDDDFVATAHFLELTKELDALTLYDGTRGDEFQTAVLASERDAMIKAGMDVPPEPEPETELTTRRGGGRVDIETLVNPPDRGETTDQLQALLRKKGPHMIPLVSLSDELKENAKFMNKETLRKMISRVTQIREGGSPDPDVCKGVFYAVREIPPNLVKAVDEWREIYSLSGLNVTWRSVAVRISETEIGYLKDCIEVLVTDDAL